MRAFLVSFLLLPLFALAAPVKPGFDEATLAALRESVAEREQRFFSGEQLKPHASVIDTAGLLLDALASGAEPAQQSRLLAAIDAQIDRDTASRSYGNIHWYQGDQTLVDRNGVEFVTRMTALAWLLYGDQLGVAERQQLRSLLEWARIGVTRHAVAISYTNIWLMKCWNLIALGEGLQDEALARQGYAMLTEWLAYTRRTGINEYLSPSYYPVDLESLALIHRLSAQPQARAEAREALDLLWHDVALNWYAPARRLGGTHSRDYDRLFNLGGLNAWVKRAGWTGEPVQPARGPYTALAWAPPPPAAGRWLQGPFPRLVSSRWGEEPEKRHTHYLGRSFSIASAESGYYAGHDNSPLVINLGGGQDVPIINFFMDGRRDYYGQNKTLEAGSGHLKALHLRPFLASVQREGEVLFLASVRERKPEYVALESVLTLPANAEFWLDDKRLDVFRAVSRWRPDYAPNGRTSSLQVEAREGVIELHLSDRDEAQGVGVSQSFPVQGGQRYRLAASLQGGEVFLYLNYLDVERRLIGGEHSLKVAGGQDGFAMREFTLPAPEGAVWCKAWLYSTRANRTELRVRDLRFEQVGPEGATLLGGFDFQVFQPQAIALPAGRTLFVRRGDAVAALRLLAAWDVAGTPIGFTLHNDGLAWQALRLTAVHSPQATDQRASLAMWAWAGEGLADEQAFARERQRILGLGGEATLQGDVVRASVGVLQLQADVVSGRRLLRQGHAEVPDSAWSVDGRAWQP
ncbi:hypothetical protein [Uliginosibacterium aquaticum]|uniref:Uncharacterized protein n=1 Tax=Uliginosibacterium aquaticum TaxID=2731212 RepID=A0ABX2ICX6_9RHOO|nr:hypothetical protein [Uliginosibacterium aquaticum]NSL54306.1 hypothetical protein [Uliginosibacterium aquaticum]